MLKNLSNEIIPTKPALPKFEDISIYDSFMSHKEKVDMERRLRIEWSNQCAKYNQIMNEFRKANSITHILDKFKKSTQIYRKTLIEQSK